MATTVLLVDDHAAFRRFAARLLEQAGYRVVGEADDGESAIALARDLDPDLVLLDVVLPDMSGFDVAEQIVLGGSAPLVVLTSSRREDELASRLRSTDASGFIAKSELSVQALRELVE